VLAAVAAGCNGSSTSGAPGSAATTAVPGMRTHLGRAERTLRLLAAPGSVPGNVSGPFQAQTGCRVSVTAAPGAGRAASMLASGGADGIAATGDVATRLIAAAAVAPLDTDLIPEYRDLASSLQNLPQDSAGGLRYGVPEVWAAQLLAYDTALVKPPRSWAGFYDGRAYPGGVAVHDSSMSIAEAALYLKSARPSLGISDPYELTPPQFAAATGLLARQHAGVGLYWADGSSEVRAFRRGTVVAGDIWPAQVRRLQAAGQGVRALVPAEGATAWAVSWMMSSRPADPNCMLRWLAYVATPIVQGHVAYALAAAPANPRACVYLEQRKPGYCTTHHVTDGGYLSRLDFWKGPQRDCGNGKHDCVAAGQWAAAWRNLTAG
jgi:putative spermidine/putrescine transport system substrate-binding protein